MPSPRRLAPDAAARLLVTHQLYALQGGNNKPFYLSNGPMGGKISVIVLGENVRETLAANLVRYDGDDPMPFDNDAPAWEQDAPATPDRNGTTPRGYLDYLTWQSRAIKLHPNDDGTVSQMRVPAEPQAARPTSRRIRLCPTDVMRSEVSCRLRPAAAERCGAMLTRSSLARSSARCARLPTASWGGCRRSRIPILARGGFSLAGSLPRRRRSSTGCSGGSRSPTRLLRDEAVRDALAEAIARAEAGGRALGRAARRVANAAGCS